MKKTAAPKKPYTCRKCDEDSFRNSMEFTRHLKKCKGPVIPPANAPIINPNLDLIEDLSQASHDAGALKASLDSLIKRLS